MEVNDFSREGPEAETVEPSIYRLAASASVHRLSRPVQACSSLCGPESRVTQHDLIFAPHSHVDVDVSQGLQGRTALI